MRLRDAIKRQAKEWKLSTTELAKRSGLSRSMVWRYLEGQCDLTGERLDKLLLAVNLVVLPWRKQYGYRKEDVDPREGGPSGGLNWTWAGVKKSKTASLPQTPDEEKKQLDERTPDPNPEQDRASLEELRELQAVLSKIRK